MRVPPKNRETRRRAGEGRNLFFTNDLWPDGYSPILSVSPCPCSKIDNKKIIIIIIIIIKIK